MIRSENVRDKRPIHSVLEAAFPNPAEADLVDRLRDAGKLMVSLVAEQEGRVVGHVAFSPVTLDAPRAALVGLGLAPVAVLPQQQRSGIGRALIAAGIDACRDRGTDFVVVLGDPTYYRQFGFVTASDVGLRNEYGVDEEFMVLTLSENTEFVTGTLVRYAAEFGEL